MISGQCVHDLVDRRAKNHVLVANMQENSLENDKLIYSSMIVPQESKYCGGLNDTKVWCTLFEPNCSLLETFSREARQLLILYTDIVAAYPSLIRTQILKGAISFSPAVNQTSKPATMAMSLGCSWSTIVPGDASLTRSSSSSSSSPTLRVSLPTHQANLRKLSSKTCAASPKPAATTPVKREPRGIMKPKPISAEMQELLGVPEIPRTQALKKIWEYIKEHNLQLFGFYLV
ncbi:hypothetical protein GIB67_035346 [Kingdonia uniflora]|uniref:SWIB domain-containing protein n=1 Tax=Kingdonia uniflora TaxID=39325 RepID=A0A7J7LYA7_9MAGN|nr:hypothetical protein GIB67_035346 [Kingdonia uniflora]